MTNRMRRVNESVRAVVAEALGDLKDPLIGLVTVTGVTVSPDLREGDIFEVYETREVERTSLDDATPAGATSGGA